MCYSSAVPSRLTGSHTRVALSVLFLATSALAQSRVDNPFADATWYLNPDYTTMVSGSISQESDPTLKAQMAKVATYPTAVWLDRIAAIKGADGRKGLAGHLDEALAQQQQGKPIIVMLVIYDLPGRDCAALASNGELKATEIARYKTEYIDAIAAIEKNSKYAGLRIVNIVEIDSLPNLVTNLSMADCATMDANGNYINGIRYALTEFHKITNVYNYIDAAHHGWIGWDTNFGPAAQKFYDTVAGTTSLNGVNVAAPGVDAVQGFITNTSNYSALVEPYLTVTNTTRDTTWLDWNFYADEKSFATAFRAKLVSLGFKSNVGMLIDTSRNGWGGAGRPTKASTASDANTMVNESRIDRRIHPGNWCNQVGAGLGERPQVVGADGIHAYVWVKPPGESDGTSSTVPNDQGKRADGMCDPAYTGNSLNKNHMSGAMPNAPLAGMWFHEQFKALVKNAYPAVPADGSTTVGDFQLAVSPSSVAMNQGLNASATVSITKLNGFSGTVSLSATGLPSGVTSSFSAPSGNASVLNLTASDSATTGSSAVTITGTSGTLTHSATLTLVVNAKGSAGFTLAASPATLTIDPGQSNTSTITVVPSGAFSGIVNLTASGAPTGVMTSFSTASTTGTSTLTFTVSPSAVAGTSTVTIVGASSNLTSSTTVTLTVNGGSSGTGGGNGSTGGGNGSTGGGQGGSTGGSGGTGGGNGAGRAGGLDGGTSSGKNGGCGCGATSPADLVLGLITLLGVATLRRRRVR